MKYNSRVVKIKIRESDTVLHLKEKLMGLTRISPDYQILTQEDAKQSLGGDDSNEQTISTAIGIKVIHLSQLSFPALRCIQIHVLMPCVNLRAWHMHHQPQKREASRHSNKIPSRHCHKRRLPRHHGQDFQYNH